MKFFDSIRKIVSFGGALAALLFLPCLILVSLVDIIGRRFFQYSSTPLQELGSQLFFASVMFAIGYTYLKDRHVRIDILRDKFSAKLRTRIERILLIIFLLPFCAVILVFGIRMTWLSYLQDEGSRAALGLSARWIVKSALPIGALLAFLAGLSHLAGSKARSGEDQ